MHMQTRTNDIPATQHDDRTLLVAFQDAKSNEEVGTGPLLPETDVQVWAKNPSTKAVDLICLVCYANGPALMQAHPPFLASLPAGMENGSRLGTFHVDKGSLLQLCFLMNWGDDERTLSGRSWQIQVLIVHTPLSSRSFLTTVVIRTCFPPR